MSDEIKERVKKLEQKVKELEEFVYSEESKVSTLDERIKDFADEMNLDIEELNSVFDFDDRPIILPDISGDSLKEKQQHFVTIFLTAMKYCYNRESINSSRLKEIAKNRGLWNTHFGNNIKNYNPYIWKEGHRSDTTYKITHPKGTKKGMGLIKGLLEGEE